MGKLVRASQGAIMDVVVDIRSKSEKYGTVYKYELSSENGHQLYVPPGFAHGFICLTDTASVLYKGTSEYNLGKYTKMFFQVLFYNSTFPLYFIFWIGLIFVVISILIIISILLSALIFNYNYNTGWPSVVILIIFFGGLIQMSIGAIGLYVGYTLEEIKKRPVLIKKKID